MSFAKKYNSGFKFDYQLPEDAPFKKCADVFEAVGTKVMRVRGMYISHTGKFGDAPVLIMDKFRLNAPNHLLKMVKEVLQDEEAIADINAGKVGCNVYQYEKDGKKHYSINWVDLKPVQPVDKMSVTDDEDLPF